MSSPSEPKDCDFVPRAERPEPIHLIPREAGRKAARVYRAPDGFEVAIPELVVAEMTAFGRQAAPREWYALLVGRLCDDGSGRHVLIDAAIPDLDAIASAGFVETTVQSEQRTRGLAALLHPTSIPVGWAHGHHRCGAVYSATDRATQATWRQPHSVGIVVDPWSSEPVGVYRGPDSEKLKETSSTARSSASKREEFPKVQRTAPSPSPTKRSSLTFSFLSFVPRSIKIAGTAAAIVAATGTVTLLHALHIITKRVDLLELDQARSAKRLDALNDEQRALKKLSVATIGSPPAPTASTPIDSGQSGSSPSVTSSLEPPARATQPAPMLPKAKKARTKSTKISPSAAAPISQSGVGGVGQEVRAAAATRPN